MPTTRKMDFGKVFTSLVRIFSKADSELMADLEDAVDVPSFSDQFNTEDKGNKARVDTGPSQSASGSGGQKMVDDYSEGSTQGGISGAYEVFARELAHQGKRVASVEKAVSSIATLLSQAIKGDAAAMFGAGDEEKPEEDEDEKDEDNTAKAVRTVPQLMSFLSGASRSGSGMNLAQPPNLATVAKARLSDADRFAKMAEQAYEAGDAKSGLQYQTLSMRHKAASAGVQVDGRYLNDQFELKNNQAPIGQMRPF